MSAGPSRLRGSEATQTQNGSLKRKRYETVEEMFETVAPEENEELSRQYRQLIQKADETKADLENTTMKDLRSAVQAGDDLFRTTKATGIATLDAKFLGSTVDSALAMARKMRTSGGTFNVDELLIRISGLLGLDRVEREDLSPAGSDDEDEARTQNVGRRARKGRLGDWEKIGWLAAKHTKRVPGIEFLNGPLAVEHTKRTVARRARRRSIGEEQRPQEIQTQARTKGQKPAVDDMVANSVLLAKLLRERDSEGNGINFLEFVINPDSFGQTVENIFYASFLIKEGAAGMQVDDDGCVIIRAEDESATEGVPKNQAIIELDMDTWREAIQLFDIRESIIPHREYQTHARPADGSWYTS